MKKYIYLLVNEENNVVAAYESKDVAEKLLGPISVKLNETIVIKKQILNSDIKVIGL